MCSSLICPAPERPSDDLDGLDAALGQAGGDVSKFLDRPVDHALPATLEYDRRDAGMMAILALDIALHDLAARARGVPGAALLGGGLRDRLFAYASAPFMKEGDDPYRDMAADTDRLLGRSGKNLGRYAAR